MRWSMEVGTGSSGGRERGVLEGPRNTAPILHGGGVVRGSISEIGGVRRRKK
jgi:hypothetical protein